MVEESLAARAIAPGELPPEVQAQLGPEARRVARRCLALLGLLSAGSLAGVAASLYLANHHPLLLIALSPLGRHLILVAATVDPAAFVVVAVVRRMLFYAPCFTLGRALGPAGIVWLEARAERAGRLVRWLEGLFQRASHAVVFFLPGPTVSTLAGISGMRTPVFAALAAAGLALRMLIVLGVAEWLRQPIQGLLAWIDAHWVAGTAGIALLIAAYRGWKIRSARHASRAARRPLR
jgi:membrane protein DedA with SNARE-associated domain